MEPGSVIVATASLAGLVPSPADPIYTLTKHAVIGFVRSVAPQLEERGIRINAVAPGFVETPLIDSAPFTAAGFPLLEPQTFAQAVSALRAAAGRSGLGRATRTRTLFRFPNVPGPRDASGASVGEPPQPTS
jgi:NAD(P)-dependent dehydrogenase (short-subunit alcohol dehydrogenase family)